MPAAEPRGVVPGSDTRRSADGPLTIGLLVALVATIVPLLRVIESGPWTVGAVVLMAAVLAAGYGARWLFRSALAATLIELAVWTGIVTAMYFGSTSIAAVIPSGASLREVPVLIAEAAEHIQVGVAPLVADRSLSFVLVAATGILALVLDHVVLTARMPLLAAVALVAVWLIPALAVPAPIDVVSFVFLAAAILYVIRAETRAREASARRVSRTFLTGRAARGVAAMSAGIATVAIVVAVVATPVLPQPAGAGSGFGTGTSIDPSLELGDDLRRPRDIAVLTVRTDADAIPYLRVATLSHFDGEVWEADRVRAVPLREGALPEVRVDDDVEVDEHRTTVEIAYLNSAWLPVPFPATAVEGLVGAWRTLPFNRTVIGESGATRGQTYQTVTHEPQPTLEQIRRTAARSDGIRDDVLAVPADVPEIVPVTAAAVTAGAETDYDALVALQDWFRGPEFQYSLEAPVADGFDGTGVEAIAEFLQVREGYCVHFASAFALMARTLGMPARIVVGYLPGVATGEEVDGEDVAQVTSSQSHAWPEVYFEGIGWVPFEPTKSLGTPTAFAPASESDGASDDSEPETETEAPTPTPTAVDPLEDPSRDQDSASGAVGQTAADPLPFLVSGLVALVVVLLPGLAGAVRRARLRALARRGRIGAAWRSVQDTAIDVGIDVPASETPRAFGARLVAQHGAPERAVATLVAAIERASYAPVRAGAGGGSAAATGGRRYGAEHAGGGLASGGAEPGGTTPVADGDAHTEAEAAAARAAAAAAGRAAAADAAAIRGAMLALLPAHARYRALLLPRSLVVRPGSSVTGSRS